VSESPNPEAPPSAVAVADPPPAPDTPVEAERPVADAAPDAPDGPGGPADPTEPVVPASPAPSAKHRSVQVPVWLLVFLAAGILVVGAFFVGRETAPESGSDAGPSTLAEAVEQTASGEMEVGDFDVRALIQALGQNPDFDLGDLGDLILGNGRN
jgi:hypothetical protein